jgi:hypothetical protein
MGIVLVGGAVRHKCYKLLLLEVFSMLGPSSTLIVGGTCLAINAVEACKVKPELRHSRMVLSRRDTGFYADVDVSWLQAAAESYHVSPDIRDYIIVPSPVVTSDIPNRNLQTFTMEELAYFDPLMGMMGYRTFVGKPTFVDHNNSDPTKAKGVNLDASMIHIPKYDVWKISVLSAFDRTKDADLCKGILKGERQAYSMGCLVAEFECSVCHHRAKKQNAADCEHMSLGKGNIVNGKLIYEVCRGINFVENSNLSGNDPADITAFAPEIFQ